MIITYNIYNIHIPHDSPIKFPSAPGLSMIFPVAFLYLYNYIYLCLIYYPRSLFSTDSCLYSIVILSCLTTLSWSIIIYWFFDIMISYTASYNNKYTRIYLLFIYSIKIIMYVYLLFPLVILFIYYTFSLFSWLYPYQDDISYIISCSIAP